MTYSCKVSYSFPRVLPIPKSAAGDSSSMLGDKGDKEDSNRESPAFPLSPQPSTDDRTQLPFPPSQCMVKGMLAREGERAIALLAFGIKYKMAIPRWFHQVICSLKQIVLCISCRDFWVKSCGTIFCWNIAKATLPETWSDSCWLWVANHSNCFLEKLFELNIHIRRWNFYHTIWVHQSPFRYQTFAATFSFRC